MVPNQFEDAIAKLGLSQRGAGGFLKINERQIRTWVAGGSHT
jgi:hypothetical protein